MIAQTSYPVSPLGRFTRTTGSTSRMPRFGNGSRVFRTRDTAGLTDEQIRTVAPSVFASEAHSSRTARYAYVPTAELLTGLRREGFLPMEIRQAGSRIEGKAEYTKHLIRFRHASQTALKVGDSVPEIVLVNSHDGTSSYQLMSGLFRLICSNGLIVSEGPQTSLRIPHSGQARDLVIDGAIEILDSLPATAEQVHSFESLDLTDGERLAFATAAIAFRYPDATAAAPAPVDAARILSTRRMADSQPTLWNTLNVVQENTVQGGQHFRTLDRNNRPRAGTTREVKGIDGNVQLNRALWVLAEEMKKLKTA